jgi:hypothetical protein
MKDKEIIYKIREWLILNVRNSQNFNPELIEDNKLLLEAIRDWKTWEENK